MSDFHVSKWCVGSLSVTKLTSKFDKHSVQVQLGEW